MSKTQIKFLQVRLNSSHFSEDNSVQGQINIKAGAITGTELGADAVDGTKIADDAIDSEHIVDGSVDNVHLANSDITIGSTTISLGDSETDLDGLTSLDVDNITVDGNTISTTDTDGDLVLNPDGDGDVDVSSAKITNLADGTASTDAINKGQLDDALSNAINGIMWKEPVLAASTGDIGANYNSGATPARLELPSSALSLDGVQNIPLGARVLLKDQADDTENGIWEVSQDGYAAGSFSVASIEIVQMNNLVAGTRGSVDLNLSQPVQTAGTQIFLEDFHGNSHTFTFGSNPGDIPLAPGNTPADLIQQKNDIAAAINSKLQGGQRVFAAQVIIPGVRIQFTEGPTVGIPATPRSASVTAGVAGLSMAAASFANPVAGDQISFNSNGLAGSHTYYDIIDSPETVGQQIYLDPAFATDAFASAIASKLNGDQRLNSAIVDPNNSSKVILEWFEKGSAQNGGPILYTAAGAAVDPADFIVTAWANGSLGDTYLVRASDMDQDAEFVSAAVLVEEGSSWEESGWICSSDELLTVGTSDIEFIRFTGLGQVTAGVGISKSYNTLDLDILRHDQELGAPQQNSFALSAGFAQAASMTSIMSHKFTQVYLNGVLLEPASGVGNIYTTAGNAGENGDYFLHNTGSQGIIELAANHLASQGDKITIIYASQS